MTLAQRLYGLFLLAYPRRFRHEFGPQMSQLFRDCYRAERNYGSRKLCSFWLRSFSDLLASAPREHLDNFRKENSSMSNLQRSIVALLVCLSIIVVAFLLLSYGRSHEVSSILFFGKSLDALVTAGIVGNLIVFGLKFSKLDPVRTALWTMLGVNVVFLVLVVMIGSRVDRTFQPGSAVAAYVVSFLFWFGLHWAWSKTNSPMAVSSD